MKRQLVLLTGHFPFPSGDGQFVRNEIDALCSEFDEVVIFSHAKSARGPHLPMPTNASYAGPARGSTGWRTIRALVSPRVLLRLVRATWFEFRSGALAKNPRAFAIACLAGIRIASFPQLTRYLADRSVATTIYSFWGMGSALALPWIRRPEGGIFVRLHRYDLYEADLYLPYRRGLFASVDRILVVSDQGREYLLQRYPHSGLDERVVVSRLGTEDPGPPVQTPAANPTLKTIVSCSSIEPVKRVDRILDGVLKMPDGIQWVHFGGGTLEKELRERVALSDLGMNVIGLMGSTDHRHIIDFYRNNRVDVFVNTSSSEGVPVSIMEAMSFGIPVVATDVGGTSEIVGREHGSGELLPEDFSDEALVETITKVLEAPNGSYNPRAAWERLCDRSVTGNLTAKIVGMHL